ncbi:unnamed protein product [Ectocarpus sp. CCAP 1310/34]|nr:unnamed protein product [Ectocarpus sp. CCAP 1310/34]
MRVAVPALLGLLGVARLGCALVLPAGRVVHRQMAETATESGGIDVPAAFATTAVATASLQQLQRSVAVWDVIMEDFEDDLELDTEDDEASREVKRRRVYVRKDYTKSGWWQELMELRETGETDHTTREARRFRNNFRVPYPFFVHLVGLVRDRDWFPTGESDVTGRQAVPVELKVLACLQILSRGNVFADIYHMSFISFQTVASTFHRFCKYFAAELYDEYVYLPTGEDLRKVMEQYDRIGFPGAVGSTDVTHIYWGMCPYNQARIYTGKEGKPTVAFQVTVDHSGRVLAVTRGFTGATNDKTIIRYDKAVTRIRTDPVYTEQKYKLYAQDGQQFEEKGCYLLVDNGYHKWRTLIPPSKCPIDRGDLIFSKRLESARKDVECYFGILKGRFRINKLAIGFHKQEYIDNVFFTCCILHNMLHSFDNRGDMSEEPNWAGSAGLHNAADRDPNTDYSSVGSMDGQHEAVEVETGFGALRSKLVTNFVYRREKKRDIVWLS